MDGELGFGIMFTAIGIGIFMLTIGGCVSVIQTHNERKECQALHIPLYRCTPQSYKADIDIKEDTVDKGER